MRGEYRGMMWSAVLAPELPPRARRIRYAPLGGGNFEGTTSACAENTLCENSKTPRHGNYLRVRGEYHWRKSHFEPLPELPPRARRIPVSNPQPSPGGGTTSACAENTKPKPVNDYGARNYLRVRGEYVALVWAVAHFMELPPRARRIHD